MIKCKKCGEMGKPHRWEKTSCHKCGSAAHCVRAKHCSFIRRVRRLRNLERYHISNRKEARGREWKEVLAELGTNCFWCGEECGVIQLEHIVPIAKGGAHIKSNIVPSCRRCNSKKATKDPLEFLWSLRLCGAQFVRSLWRWKCTKSF